MTFKTKYPWPEIKTKYVEGIRQDDGSLIYPTLDELADEYGCCISTTLRRSALGKWQTERLMFLNKLEQARQENRVAFLASQSAEFDRNVLELTLAGIIEITKHFEAYKKSKNILKTDELEALARTLERLQKVGKLIFGEITESSDLNLYIGAREKLLRKLDELANEHESEADATEVI